MMFVIFVLMLANAVMATDTLRLEVKTIGHQMYGLDDRLGTFVLGIVCICLWILVVILGSYCMGVLS